MKKYILLLPLVALGGCETMFAHFTLNERAVKDYGVRNATANACVLTGNTEPSDVAEYNYYAALMLDFAVFNKDNFKKHYDETAAQLKNMNRTSELASFCDKVRPLWVSNTEHVESEYQRATSEVGQMRAREMAQIGRTASEAGQAFAIAGSRSSDYYIHTVPPVTFAPSTQSNVNSFLINTKNGVIQCKYTSKGYVFCI